MPPDPAAPPPGRLLDRPRPCVRCTYDLFRQPLDGKCPDCGTGVAASLQTRYLRTPAPPTCAPCARGPTSSSPSSSSPSSHSPPRWPCTCLPLPWLWRASFIFQLLLDLGCLAATWRLTVADPGLRRPVRRWAVRAVVLLLAVAQVGLAAFVIAWSTNPNAHRLWVMIVTTATLEAVTALAFGFTVAGLSARLPAPGLARGIRIASVGLFVALLPAVAWGVLILAFLHSHVTYQTVERVSRLLTWPENTGRAVFGVAAAVLLWAFARRLRAESAEAALGAPDTIPAL